LINIIFLYVKLIGIVLLGLVLGRKVTPTVPNNLGTFLYWVGIPISIVSFVRKADLSAQVLMAPIIALTATFFGAILAALVIKLQVYFTKNQPSPQTKASFILATMVGNTGYLGFPVSLAVVGQEYFAWALFYDMLGTLFGAYIIGVAIAAHYGNQNSDIESNFQSNFWQVIKAVIINPALWSFGLGLLFQQVALPKFWENCLNILGWSGVGLSLILMGMRLSKLSNLRKNLGWASATLFIKMLLIPFVFSKALPLFDLPPGAAKAILLQMAMPPAFATLVLSEAYNLDKDLSVTALALGAILLLFTLPLFAI
jgi:malate permease and related proteins